MVITPQSEVHMLSGVPLTPDYQHTMSFATPAAQESFFSSHRTGTSMTATTYTRVEGRDYVSMRGIADSMVNCNYMMFRNQPMSGKWYYAFVRSVEYINTEMTKVWFELDVMQSYQFDYTLKECFIERSHVGTQSTSDLWVAPESLEMGKEYETISSIGFDSVTASNSYLLLTSTVDLTQPFGDVIDPKISGAEGCLVDNLPSGCDYYVIGGEYGENIEQVFTALQAFPWISKGIIGLTVLPKQMLNNATINTVRMGDGSTVIGRLSNNFPSSRKVADVGVFDPFAQREPEFVKFYGFPYSYIEVTCFNGSILKVYPQYTKGGKLTIRCDTVISSAPEMKYYFSDYLGDMYDRSITLADFPEMPVQDSSYLMVNNRRQAVADGVGELATRAYNNFERASDGLLGAMAGTVQPITDVINRYVPQKFKLMDGMSDVAMTLMNVVNPDVGCPTLANQRGGSTFNYAQGKMGVWVKWKMIGKPYRDMIRDFWNRYGYQVNRIKVPATDTMSRFNYIKTKGCLIDGQIDSTHYDQIVSIYNNGVTIWHDADIGNYKGNVALKAAYGGS